MLPFVAVVNTINKSNLYKIEFISALDSNRSDHSLWQSHGKQLERQTHNDHISNPIYEVGRTSWKWGGNIKS